VTTGFDFEEIRKAWIIGVLTNHLLEAMHYRDTVVLDFNHKYGWPVAREDFLSLGNGSAASYEPGYFPLGPMTADSSALVIRQIAHRFDVSVVLKLVEFGVQHRDVIRSEQRCADFQYGIERFPVFTVPVNRLREIVNAPVSDLVTRILHERVFRQDDRPIDQERSGVSYYYQDGKYHVFSHFVEGVAKDSGFVWVTSDSVRLVLADIVQFDPLSGKDCVVFDTDSSLYVVPHDGSHRYRRHLFHPRGAAPEPFKVISLRWDMMAISYSWSAGFLKHWGNRVMIYLPSEDRLVPDLGRVIRKAR
jgi:hypothetical protein